MKNLTYIFLLLIMSVTCSSHDEMDICKQWDILDKQIRDSKIDKTLAKIRIIELNTQLINIYRKRIKDEDFAFPVKNYTSKAIGGRNGSGYIPGNYNFYDGNKHGGHPAHDIFIHDQDQDSICDKTTSPVEILSFTSGIVIGVYKAWVKGSGIRGGNIVWTFNPHKQIYYYYAHLNSVTVNPGDIVHAGDCIGYMGRTGKNAWPARAPTHLHFMALKFNNGEMTSYNTFNELINTTLASDDSRYKWLKEKIIKKRIKDIPLPNGYKRISIQKNSFSDWLRNLPLKSKGSPVYLYNGKKKRNQNAHYIVIDIDTGNTDLQQCADAIMRLRAEYLFYTKTYSEIHFNFVSGFRADYSKWKQGYRIKVSGNKVLWIKSTEENTSYISFRKYLNIVFNYANTHSLSKEMKSVSNITDMKIGDIFLQGGFPGHGVIIMDIAINNKNEKIFLLAQSYMPAQDIHILKSPFKISPWYKVDFGDTLKTPEWKFKRTDIKKF